MDENQEAIRNARANRLKLGLDLQGGMYVTMEVDIAQMLEKMAKNRDEKLDAILGKTKHEASLSDENILDIFRRNCETEGVRLSRYFGGDPRQDNAAVISSLQDETNKAVDRALQVIKNRIDQYGVSEVSIQKSGSRRIVLELPGVSNEKEVSSLIQETALLEFKLLADPKIVNRALDIFDKLYAGKSIDNPVDSGAVAAADSTAKNVTAADTTAVAAATQAEDSAAAAAQKAARNPRDNPFRSLFLQMDDTRMTATPVNKERISAIMRRAEFRRALPRDISFVWSAKPERDGNYEFFALKMDAELTGEVITNARAQSDQQGFGGAVVTMEMNDKGTRMWAQITGANVQKRIAIVLDSVVYSAPVVRQKITGGNSQIEGMANMDEARLLEIVLKAGALPAPVEIIEERTVGPSLGEDSIQKGMWSFIIGVGAVLLFMVFYYKTSGVPADVAVIFNVVFILGILAGFKATLTLPGIAGMLLTVGMAVDANVLINERVREELLTGKTLRAALDAGYKHAMPAIIDGNLTTLITSLILYQFGSGPIQGFALTLTIGLVCSLFTAIIMTRVIFELVIDKHANIVKFE
jgi:preprotein translocase subunit SecD